MNKQGTFETIINNEWVLIIKSIVQVSAPYLFFLYRYRGTGTIFGRFKKKASFYPFYDILYYLQVTAVKYFDTTEVPRIVPRYFDYRGRPTLMIRHASN